MHRLLVEFRLFSHFKLTLHVIAGLTMDGIHDELYAEYTCMQISAIRPRIDQKCYNHDHI